MNDNRKHWFWQALAWPSLMASFLILVMLLLQKLRQSYVLPSENTDIIPTAYTNHPALPVLGFVLGLLGLLFLSAGKRTEAAATYATPPLHNSRGRIWVGLLVVILLVTLIMVRWFC